MNEKEEKAWWEDEFDKQMRDFPVNTTYLYTEGFDGKKLGLARLAKVKQIMQSILSQHNEKLVEKMEKEKQTDENQMSYDHAFDDGLDTAISIVKESILQDKTKE